MPRLTELSLKNLAPPADGRITIWDGPLGVRVTASGVKTFIAMIGSGRRHTIGRYPIVTLAQARAAATKLKAEKTLGRIFPELVSLNETRTAYLAQADLRPNTRMYTERNLNRLISTRLTDITPREITRILDGLAPSSASQALRVYTAFFNWCIRKHYLEKSPCDRMQATHSTARSRLLSDAEVQLIWQATEAPSTFHTIVRLLLLTGQRRTEIAALQHSWIKDTTITLPKEITKNGRGHTFPVGNLAQVLLSCLAASSHLLFPARGSSTTPFNGWSKSKAALDKASGVTDWTLHDLRRYFASTHAKIGTPIHITERLLNHVSGSQSGIVSVYQRHEYRDEMRQAAERYEAHLATLLTPA